MVNNIGMELPDQGSDGSDADAGATVTAQLANLSVSVEPGEMSTHTGTDADVSTACATPEPTAQRKLKGKKAKDAKRAARAREMQLGGEAVDGGETDVDHVCQVCKANFSTRNKLFTHINKTGHAALKACTILGL